MKRPATTTTTRSKKSKKLKSSAWTDEKFNAFCTEKTLNLSLKGLIAADMKAVVLFLQSHPHITELDVSANNIGAEGAAALARNTTLTSLEVLSNNIGAEGAAALARNTTLTSLNVRYNDIGPEGATALARNTTLISLHVDANGLNREIEEGLQEHIKSNQRRQRATQTWVLVAGFLNANHHSPFKHAIHDLGPLVLAFCGTETNRQEIETMVEMVQTDPYLFRDTQQVRLFANLAPTPVTETTEEKRSEASMDLTS